MADKQKKKSGKPMARLSPETYRKLRAIIGAKGIRSVGMYIDDRFGAEIDKDYRNIVKEPPRT